MTPPRTGKVNSAGRTAHVRVRITAPDQVTSDAVRVALEELVPGLRLQRGRTGRNPKYANDPKVLAYGELELFLPGEVLEAVSAEGFSFPRRSRSGGGR